MLAAKLGVPILESTSETSNLEDVFFQLTEANQEEVSR